MPKPWPCGEWKKSYTKAGPICPLNDFIETIITTITETIDNLNKEKKIKCQIPNEIEFDIPLCHMGGVSIKESPDEFREKRIRFTVPIEKVEVTVDEVNEILNIEEQDTK